MQLKLSYSKRSIRPLDHLWKSRVAMLCGMKWENENFFFDFQLCLPEYVLFCPLSLDWFTPEDACDIIWDFDLDLIGQVFRKRPTWSESQVKNIREENLFLSLDQVLAPEPIKSSWSRSHCKIMSSIADLAGINRSSSQRKDEVNLQRKVVITGQRNKYVCATILFYIFSVTKTSSVSKR